MMSKYLIIGMCDSNNRTIYIYKSYQIHSPDLRIYRSIPPKMGETYVATGITGRVEIQIVSLINQFHDIYIIVILNRFEREHTSQAIVLHKFSHLAFSCELVD